MALLEMNADYYIRCFAKRFGAKKYYEIAAKVKDSKIIREYIQGCKALELAPEADFLVQQVFEIPELGDVIYVELGAIYALYHYYSFQNEKYLGDLELMEIYEAIKASSLKLFIREHSE